MALSKVPVVAGTKTLTRGSIVAGNASGEPAALAIGSNTYVLKSDGTDISWGADAGGAALTGSTNNTVTTVTGANAIQGETNFIYNGTIVGCGPDGANADLGVGLHIKTADSGASVDVNSDELVLENSGHSGMTILSGTGNSGYIVWGDSGNNAIGRIFYNHASNYMRFDTNGSEAMRIRDDGEVLIGTANSSNVKLKVEQANAQSLARFFATDTGNTATLFKIKSDNTSGGNYISFNIDKAGTSTLNIEGDGDVKNTNNSYGAISDERIKKDITDANSQWDDIKALKIKNYKLKTDDNSPTQLGVIAQDLETDGMSGLVKDSRPEAYLVNINSDFGTLVDGTADNGAEEIHDEDGKITGYEKVFTEGQKVKSVKYSVLYMKAIKALQESMERIEQLEAKVTALENA